MSAVPGLMDDMLMDDDFTSISVVPSKVGNDRVIKVCSVEIGTDDVYELDEETNTVNRKKNIETQTDIYEQEDEKETEVDYEHLGNWLESIYPRLSNILEQSESSRAFEHYELKQEDTLEANSLQYTLTTTFEFTDAGTGEDEEDGGDDTGSFQEYQDDIDDWGDMHSISKKTKPSAADSSSLHSRAAHRSAIDHEETKTLTFDVTSLSWSCNGSTLAVAYGKQNHPSMSFQGCVSVWGIFRRDLEPSKPSKNIEVSN